MVINGGLMGFHGIMDKSMDNGMLILVGTYLYRLLGIWSGFFVGDKEIGSMDNLWINLWIIYG